MEKQLLKEELSRIWEIMGVKGDKTLLRESIIDDLVQMIIKKGAGEADVAVQLAKIQADFPYLKGLTKTDLGKLAKGGVDAAPVIQKIVGKMSGDQLTSLANDIYKNSVDIQDLIKNQMDGITANIKSGSLDVAGAQRYISDNVNDWIKPVGGSADNLVAKLRTRLMDELGGQVQDVAAGVSKVATEVQDDISKLFDDITSTGDDIGATIPKIESELSKQIKSSKQFQDLKLPSNITPDDLATEVSSSIAAKLNKQADMVDPKVWDSLPPTAQMKYLQDALSNLKAVNPTYYNKVLKKIQDFFTTNPNKKLKWSRAKQIWILGMIPVAAYQIKDVVDTVKMDGSASDIGVGIADAVLKTTL